MSETKNTKPKMIPKKADYTTVICFIRHKRLEYSLKDMHEIGKKLADLYRSIYKKEPLTVQQVEGRQVIVVNAYPYEFSKHIAKVVSEHFKYTNRGAVVK